MAKPIPPISQKPVSVEVWKAGRLGDRQTPDLVVEAHREFPDVHALGSDVGPEDAEAMHSSDARRLCSGLLATLPGGTIDRLLIYLLEHRASVLRVRYPTEEKDDGK